MWIRLGATAFLGMVFVQALPVIQGGWGPTLLLSGTIWTAALFIGRKLRNMHSILLRFDNEHEMLILDYCARQEPPISPAQLPTRSDRGRITL